MYFFFQITKLYYILLRFTNGIKFKLMFFYSLFFIVSKGYFWKNKKFILFFSIFTLSLDLEVKWLSQQVSNTLSLGLELKWPSQQVSIDSNNSDNISFTLCLVPKSLGTIVFGPNCPKNLKEKCKKKKHKKKKTKWKIKNKK